MQSSNPDISQQPVISSHDDNNTILTTCDTNNTLERLKQQLNSNNSNINESLISTAIQTNHNQLHTPIFTSSQKDILRLIGQHLQSIGLR